MNDYDRIAGIIRYLEENFQEQPNLATIAAKAGLSESHFQRLFSRWAGVSPKAFLQCLTLEHAKRLLERGNNVLDASLDSGLSGPSRLHDLCLKLEAASPGEIKAAGLGWTIKYGFAPSPFGRILMATAPRGICHLSFIDNKSEQTAINEIETTWPQAKLQRDTSGTETLAKNIFSQTPAKNSPLQAYVQGTNFQIRVWKALLKIPAGELSSYKQISDSIGNPKASRAVGTAIGRNPLAFLIPCHRVIRETGALGGYRWGLTRKRAMIALENTSTRPE